MVTLVVVVIIIAAGVIWFATSDNSTTSTNNNAQSTTSNTNDQSTISANTNTETPINTNANSAPTLNGEQGQLSGEPIVGGPDVLVTEVKYDGSSFSPKTLNIKVGDVVVFKNESDKAFWPASGPHPQHTNYPEFDPKKEIVAGGSWQFTFTKAGTWPFHDHRNPSVFGSITVTK